MAAEERTFGCGNRGGTGGDPAGDGDLRGQPVRTFWVVCGGLVLVGIILGAWEAPLLQHLAASILIFGAVVSILGRNFAPGTRLGTVRLAVLRGFAAAGVLLAAAAGVLLYLIVVVFIVMIAVWPILFSFTGA